jgi:hypothetical protein
MRGVCELK